MFRLLNDKPPGPSMATFATSTVAALALSVGAASALTTPTVTVDGILEAGEYLGGIAGTDHGILNVPWYNDYHSIYDDPNRQSNDLLWEISGSGSSFMLNVFFEVPGYARRMIWADTCVYDDGVANSDCDPLIAGLKTNHGLSDADVMAVLDAYEDNNDGVANMDYGTQTGSEEFELETAGGGASLFFLEWDRGSEDANGALEYQSSLDYLLAANGNPNTTPICSTIFCDAFDQTASIEIKWGFDSKGEAAAVLNSIGRMRLHLSNEARGVPEFSSAPCAQGQCDDPSPVPVPASLPLLLAGMGSIGILARRKRNSA